MHSLPSQPFELGQYREFGDQLAYSLDSTVDMTIAAGYMEAAAASNWTNRCRLTLVHASFVADECLSGSRYIVLFLLHLCYVIWAVVGSFPQTVAVHGGRSTLHLGSCVVSLLHVRFSDHFVSLIFIQRVSSAGNDVCVRLYIDSLKQKFEENLPHFCVCISWQFHLKRNVCFQL